MVNATVERATSDMLIGPDWAMNIEICDMLNQNPGQAKDVAKSIKKRITSKNSKVQLLALTLLETIIKNCGDVVHMHVAEKDVLHEMVRLVKKKPDYHVKEKILILIDTWQEAFGGPRARYPQYYAAYQELLRAGAVFPQRSERSAPVFTPPQTQPLASYPQNMRSSDYNVDRAETSSEADYPTLSLSEIQNARGAMDILSEMLSAIEPGNKQALRQEVVVDLVDQCRTYKQRVVHLVNSTSDESLLCQGLTLNDDLQRLLAKHEAIASGTFVKPEKPKPESSKSLVDVDSPLVDTGDNGKLVDGSSTGVNALVPLTPPAAANGPTTTPQTVSKIDLLSGDLLGGDDFNSLALVPVSTPQPPSPVASDQNALALVDMFPVSNSNQNTASAQPAFSSGQAYPMSPEFQHQQHLQVPQAAVNMNGSIPGMVNMNGSNAGMGSPYEQAAYPQTANAFWNGQSMQQQQPTSPVYGAQNGGAFPPPPWESQPTDNTQPFGSAYPQMQLATVSGPQSPRLQGSTPPLGLPNPGGDQVVGMFVQPITGGQLTAINQSFQGYQMPGMYPQHMQGAQMMGMLPQAMQAGQTASMYPQQIYGNQMAGYGYGYGYGQGQQQDTQFLEHRMYGLSMSDNSALKNSSSQSSLASYLPPMKQANKGDDKLFGDLVDMAKTKPVKSTPGGAGSV